MAEAKIPTGASSSANGPRPVLPWEPARAPAPNGSGGAADQSGLTDSAQGVHALQQVKGRVHRRLLERLNLSNLDRLERQPVAEAGRPVEHKLNSHEPIA